MRPAKAVEVDCETGKVTRRDLTDEEKSHRAIAGADATERAAHELRRTERLAALRAKEDALTAEEQAEAIDLLLGRR